MEGNEAIGRKECAHCESGRRRRRGGVRLLISNTSIAHRFLPFGSEMMRHASCDALVSRVCADAAQRNASQAHLAAHSKCRRATPVSIFFFFFFFALLRSS